MRYYSWVQIERVCVCVCVGGGGCGAYWGPKGNSFVNLL